MVRVVCILLFSVLISCQQKLCPTYSSVNELNVEYIIDQSVNSNIDSKKEVSL